jgi:DNA-binding NtrC family response regulator
VSRYDGERFTTFTTQDGLAHNEVYSIVADRAGQLWFGTWGGVSCYDGERFTSFTTEDGLADNHMWAILEDRAGHLWFGTFGGGVSRYDGLVFQTLLQRDGLAYNSVHKILQSRNGDLWITTERGVTRYRPRPTSPSIRLTGVVADRRYDPATEIHLSSSQRLVAFEFQGRSFTTPSDQMVYAYRLEGYDKDWRWTRERRAEYHDLPLGEYTFQVRAVDRDLNYSEVAEVRLTVIPDPRIEGLTEALQAGGSPGEFIGKSPALQRGLARIEEVAKADMTVLILGETGTGKGLVARAIHGLSARRNGPFIQVNCGAIPEGLVESELFGHEKGAFTGAVTRRLGRFELAEGGALFLDEIGDLALSAQVKLLRFLEDRVFERVGGEKSLKADVRVIAATNRDVAQMMAQRQFREDLYYRLWEFTLQVPPLRERREDIPMLAAYFLLRMARHLNKGVTHLTPGALALLSGYDWPGNVRELEHAVQRAVVVCQGPAIRPEEIVLESRKTDRETSEEVVSLEENERRHIRRALERTGWVIKGAQGAAALLGVPESTLRYRMKQLGITRR